MLHYLWECGRVKDFTRFWGRRSEDDKAIKSAYRKLARSTTDVKGQGRPSGDRRAYEVLFRTEKRSRYDTLVLHGSDTHQGAPSGQTGAGPCHNTEG